MKKVLITLFILSSFVFSAQPIYDYAKIIKWDSKEKEQFIKYNNKLLEVYDIDFRIITFVKNKDIDVYSNKVFNHFKSKSKSKSGRTILMVLNPKQDQVRVEVSMALEPIYTDSFISYIERKGLVPYFQDNKVSDGVYAMSELITDRASEAKKGNEFMPPMESKSIGAGAKTKASMGTQSSKHGKLVSSRGNSPESVYDEYLAILKKHNKNPNLELYTDDTKKFFKSWTVTDINQNHEIEFIEKCDKDKILFKNNENTYAVLMNNPVKQRTCSPYFFKKENGKWKLDISTMSKVIKFNQPMEWHFNKTERKRYASDYDFIFDRFSYDKNGYPFNKVEKGRWGFTCSGMYFPQDPNKTTYCWISNLRTDGVALNNLKLEPRDIVIAVGKDKKTATYNMFMKYMKETKKGQKAYVRVLRGKERKKIDLSAIAPK